MNQNVKGNVRTHPCFLKCILKSLHPQESMGAIYNHLSILAPFHDMVGYTCDVLPWIVYLAFKNHILGKECIFLEGTKDNRGFLHCV